MVVGLGMVGIGSFKIQPPEVEVMALTIQHSSRRCYHWTQLESTSSGPVGRNLISHTTGLASQVCLWTRATASCGDLNADVPL